MATTDKSPQPARRTNQRQRAGRAANGSRPSSAPRTATVDLPFVTAEFRMPEVRMPELRMPDLRMPDLRIPDLRIPDLRMPDLRMPDLAQLSVPGASSSDVNGAVAFVRSYLPPPQQAAYYACLGVLGALQLVEWPVVAAIAAGGAVSRQVAGGQQSDGSTSRSA